MPLPFLRKVPGTQREWLDFHFQHYIDHRQILAVVEQKTNSKLFMPLIWPVPGNNYDARLAEFHQQLHQQMNVVSGSPSTDMSQVNLSSPDGAKQFINVNYRDHYIFHQLVGIPV